MRKRWTAQKRSHPILELGDSSKGDDSVLPLDDEPADERVETIEAADSPSLESISEHFEWAVVQPTPKAGFKNLPKRQKFDIIDLEDEADVASQDATPIGGFACFDKNSFQVNSFVAKISMVFKQAWEKGKMNKLFGKWLDFGRTVPPVDVIGRHGWTVVIKIHQFLEDEVKDIIDRVFVGHLLHLLYVRGRWSDLAAVQNGEID